jgi:prepilin-type N-terminal cleavage/methylation domain-containing protein/prepilin-type processing-associated H-X9-DG protein
MCLMNPANINIKREAFTLIELLVVIAIIGILTALLLPVLGGSKATAKGAQCLNDHRQLVLAWTMYGHDNDDRLPGLEEWVVGNMQDPFDATNVSLLVDPTQSTLARYIPTPQIYKCPGDMSRLVRSVSMNCRMNTDNPLTGPWLGGSGQSYQIFTKLQQIRNPADIYAILDERSDTINDSSLTVDMSNTGNSDGVGASDPYWIIDYPAGYHNGSGRFSFADGHVEGHRWLESTLLAPLGQSHGMHTLATDRDVRWLQEHCTYLK